LAAGKIRKLLIFPDSGCGTDKAIEVIETNPLETVMSHIASVFYFNLKNHYVACNRELLPTYLLSTETGLLGIY